MAKSGSSESKRRARAVAGNVAGDTATPAGATPKRRRVPARGAEQAAVKSTANAATTPAPRATSSSATARTVAVPARPPRSSEPRDGYLDHDLHEPESPSFLNQVLDAVAGVVSGTFDGFAPETLRQLEEEVREKIAQSPMELNSYGYDPWGFNTDVARRALLVTALMYRYYFRAQTYGIENMPKGRVLVIANHAGQIAIDATMIGTAAVLEAKPPRILRGMGEYWLPTLPLFNVLMARVGSVVGTPKNAVDLLEHGEAVIAFPEGVRGMNKSFSERYKLKEFGLGFMRLALQTNTPILPVAVVGSEEQAPSFGNFKPLARLLGMPAFPLVITPVPFPVRYHIYFGEPMEFRGNPNDEDQVIEEKVEQVKAKIRSMIEAGLRRRRSIFF